MNLLDLIGLFEVKMREAQEKRDVPTRSEWSEYYDGMAEAYADAVQLLRHYEQKRVRHELDGEGVVSPYSQLFKDDSRFYTVHKRCRVKE